jgi:hypothetical protein
LLATTLSAAGFSMFYEELTAKATVTTGTLDGSVVCANGADNEATGWPTGQPYDSYPALEHPVDIAGGGVQQPDVQHLTIELKDAYPGYAYRCEVRVQNTGTVAWHLENVAYIVQKCDANGKHCAPLLPGPSIHASWTTHCDGSVCAWGDLGVAPPSPHPLTDWSPIYASVKDQEGCQVHADDPSLTAWLLVGVNGSAEENAVYKISLSYQLKQWNESAWYGCTQPRTP